MIPVSQKRADALRRAAHNIPASMATKIMVHADGGCTVIHENNTIQAVEGAWQAAKACWPNANDEAILGHANRMAFYPKTQRPSELLG